jgi:hypothetical protein
MRALHAASNPIDAIGVRGKKWDSDKSEVIDEKPKTANGVSRKANKKLSTSAPLGFHYGSSIEYEIKARKAEKSYHGPSPHIVVAFALVYVFAVVLGVCFLVLNDLCIIELVLLIPVTLGLLML